MITDLEVTARRFIRESSRIEIRLVGGGPTMSGVFTDSITTAAEVAKVDGKRNVYGVANPIKPEWSPPTTGKFVRAGKATCVGDDDIDHRAWFLIDIDSKGKGKQSATDAEIAAAVGVGDAVQDFLASLGWPPPLVGFSGNGCWLFYRVDLPNDHETKLLYDAALGVLGLRFNGDGCEIDPSAATAARLVPYFGTMKMKGENTPERPHRRSAIADIGSTELVSLDQLKQLAGMKPKAGEQAPPGSSGRAFRKLEEILDAAAIQHTAGSVVADVTWFGVFGADGNCPFGDSSGNGGKCGVGQDQSGKLYGHCFAGDHPWAEWKDILNLAPFFSGGTSTDGRPTIVVGDEMNVTSSLAWDAVLMQNDPPKLFAFGGALVEVVGC